MDKLRNVFARSIGWWRQGKMKNRRYTDILGGGASIIKVERENRQDDDESEGKVEGGTAR